MIAGSVLHKVAGTENSFIVLDCDWQGLRLVMPPHFRLGRLAGWTRQEVGLIFTL